eukprot:scaffold318530_cov39-Tisochrysis_lutea.AAC.1
MCDGLTTDPSPSSALFPPFRQAWPPLAGAYQSRRSTSESRDAAAYERSTAGCAGPMILLESGTALASGRRTRCSAQMGTQLASRTRTTR